MEKRCFKVITKKEKYRGRKPQILKESREEELRTKIENREKKQIQKEETTLRKHKCINERIGENEKKKTWMPDKVE